MTCTKLAWREAQAAGRLTQAARERRAAASHRPVPAGPFRCVEHNGNVWWWRGAAGLGMGTWEIEGHPRGKVWDTRRGTVWDTVGKAGSHGTPGATAQMSHCHFKFIFITNSWALQGEGEGRAPG